MTNLGTLGGLVSEVTALNERGEAVGASETSTVDPLGEEFCGGTFFDQNQVVCLPFLWQLGQMTPLPTLGGNNGAAFGINNRGQVVGVAENATHDPTCVPPQVLQFKPVIWENGEVHTLPTVPGYPDGIAQSINDSGQAVGVSTDCIFVTAHGLLWEHGTFTDLGSLGGTTTAPSAINNRAQVIGSATLAGATIGHAFLWQDGLITDIGPLPGDVEDFGNAINDKGQVLGQSCDANSNCRAFLWENGAMADLNSLIPADSQLQLYDANGINSRGEIVGLAIQTSSGELRAYLATPCDEMPANAAGCEDGSGGLALAGRETNQRPNVILPESVRTMLRQRLGSRYHIPGLLPPTR
jgi:probable HAF family extracellular repeat protein